MSFQTRETSVHLGTQIKIFLMDLRALRPSIDSKSPYTIKVQKRSKEIGKIIHVTLGVQP